MGKRKSNETRCSKKTFNVCITSKKKFFCTVTDLIKKFNQELKKFKVHIFTTTHQYKFFSELEENLPANVVYLTVDFSQNFVGKYHRQISSAHYGASKKQVSLHTGGYYYKEDNQIEFKSFITASDCLRHDTSAVWRHIEPIMKKIKQDLPNTKIIYFRSDGPSTQYKNKTNFYLLRKYSEKYGFKCTYWNFSAPGHSKSVADSVGGVGKSLLNRAVYGGVDITNAEEVVEYIQTNSQVSTFLVTESEIELIEKSVPNDLTTIKGTKNVYQVAWTSDQNSKLNFRYLSCIRCSSNEKCQHYDMPSTSIDYDKSTTKASKSRKKTNCKIKVYCKSVYCCNI